MELIWGVCSTIWSILAFSWRNKLGPKTVAKLWIGIILTSENCCTLMRNWKRYLSSAYGTGCNLVNKYLMYSNRNILFSIPDLVTIPPTNQSDCDSNQKQDSDKVGVTMTVTRQHRGQDKTRQDRNKTRDSERNKTVTETRSDRQTRQEIDSDKRQDKRMIETVTREGKTNHQRWYNSCNGSKAWRDREVRASKASWDRRRRGDRFRHSNRHPLPSQIDFCILRSTLSFLTIERFLQPSKRLSKTNCQCWLWRNETRTFVDVINAFGKHQWKFWAILLLHLLLQRHSEHFLCCTARQSTDRLTNW